MDLLKQIEQSYLSAFREKKQAALDVLRMLKSVIKNKTIELKKEMLDEQEIIAVIKSEVKKRKDSIESFKSGGRDDLVQKEQAEIEILEKFLPAQMSEEDVRAKAKQVIDALPEEDKENFGKAMAAVMADLKGTADGAVVSKVVKELL